jgi:hypothetical protein
MTTPEVSPLTLELLVWISSRPRTYPETMEVWGSNCPRHPVWEDALLADLVQVVQSEVVLTQFGRAALGARESAANPAE